MVTPIARSSISKINEVTKDYSGMKVPVKVSVDTDNKEFEVRIGTITDSKSVGTITATSDVELNKKIEELFQSYRSAN